MGRPLTGKGGIYESKGMKKQARAENDKSLARIGELNDEME